MTASNDIYPPAPPEGRYLVTGASGFIGTRWCRRLVEAGNKVLALDLRRSDKLPTEVEFAPVDITNRALVESAVSDFQPDYGFHLAARVGDWGPASSYQAINVEGTRNVLDALIANGAKRAVHLSSIAALGHAPRALADETDPPIDSHDAYSQSKADSERLARRMQADGAPIVVIRPGDVYGVGSVPWVLRPTELLRSKRLFLVDGGKGIMAPVHVDNLLDGFSLVLAREEALGQVYQILDGDGGIPFGEYFTELARALELPTPKLSLPKWAALSVGALSEAWATMTRTDPQITRTAVQFVCRSGGYSAAKARAELGYRPRRTLPEGLSDLTADDI